MRSLSRALAAAVAAALALPVLAGAAQAAGTHGVVVQRDAKAGALVVATRNGTLRRVALTRPNRLALGTVVQVTGTKVAVVGHSRTAKLRGVVVRRHRHSFALAGNGSVLAVTSPTPPAPGQSVTATVQVTNGALSDDDGNEHVDDSQVPSAELRGTVLTQDASALRLTVPGFPSGLAILLGGMSIPVLAPGTPVEARVALGPDPANPDAIVLTLVSLHVEGAGGDPHGDRVHAEGQVTAVTEAGPAGGDPGSITIQGEHGAVTFIIPAGFGATGVSVGDDVEASGTPAATADGQPTLTRLEGRQGDSGLGNAGGDDGGGGDGHNSSGDN
jgi:hypothetical protein